MREVAAQLQAEKAAAAKATEVARHNACALRQPDEPPAVEVGSHLEVLVLIEEPEEDGSISKEYNQWVAVVVVAAADGTAAHKKPTATGQMRKVNTGWFLARYEDDGVEEWLRLPGDAFNNNARGSWRVDLDFEASGGIEGGGGGGGDERGRGDSGGGGGDNGDEPEEGSGKEESGDESEDDDSSDEDEDGDDGR